MSYPNMSYCMFENTMHAMNQLLGAMEDEGGALLADMSSEERRAFAQLFNQCESYVEMAQAMQEEFEEMEKDFG